MLAPAHARLALHHIDDAFEMTVMMRAGLGVRLDGHGTRPQFLCPDACKVDRRLAVHPGRRRHVGIKLVPRNDTDAVMFPTVVIVRMIVRMSVIVVRVVVVACHRLLSPRIEKQTVKKSAPPAQPYLGTFAATPTCSRRRSFEGDSHE